MKISKQTFTAFILGAVIMAAGYLGVVFYKSIQKIQAHEQALIQIVNIINQANQQAAAPVAQAQISE
jgi:predicted negative regulator of RcsB-dependent stress response